MTNARSRERLKADAIGIVQSSDTPLTTREVKDRLKEFYGGMLNTSTYRIAQYLRAGSPAISFDRGEWTTGTTDTPKAMPPESKPQAVTREQLGLSHRQV